MRQRPARKSRSATGRLREYCSFQPGHPSALPAGYPAESEDRRVSWRDARTKAYVWRYARPGETASRLDPGTASRCQSSETSVSISILFGAEHIVCVSALPGKADPPLDVYANTVASSPATLQRFQPVTRRRAKIAEFPGVMQEQKLTSGDTLDRAKPLHGLILEQLRGVRAAKRAYQSPFYYVSRNTSNAIGSCCFFAFSGLCLAAPASAHICNAAPSIPPSCRAAGFASSSSAVT